MLNTGAGSPVRVVVPASSRGVPMAPRSIGGAALLVVFFLLLTAPLAAQDTPTAWPLDKRPLADTLSTLAEAAAIGLDLYHDVTSAPPDRRWAVAGCDGIKYGAIQLTVEGLKHVTHEERPDHTDFLSFPSGHVTNAFAAMNGWKWGVSLSLAVGTGYLRPAANRHWTWPDVVAGAVLGSLINVGVAQIPACRGTLR